MKEIDEKVTPEPSPDDENEPRNESSEVSGEYHLNEGDLELGDDFISSALAELERVPDAPVSRRKKNRGTAPGTGNIGLDLEIVEDDDDTGITVMAAGAGIKDTAMLRSDSVEDDSETEQQALLRKKVAFLEERLRLRSESYHTKIDGLQAEVKKKTAGMRKMKEQMESLQKELDTVREEAAENKDNWVRAAAEYRNLQRRSRVKMNEFVEMEKLLLIKQILPVFDNLVRSLDYSQPSQALVEGVRLIAKQCEEILDGWEVRVMDAEHQPFDPYCHEAVTRIKNEDLPNNTNIEVLQRGYMIGDRVLRPAKVTVSYRTDNQKPPEPVQEASGGNFEEGAIKDGNLLDNSVKSQQITRDNDRDPGEDVGLEDVEETKET